MRSVRIGIPTHNRSSRFRRWIMLRLEQLENRSLLSFIAQSPFLAVGMNPAAAIAGDLFNHQQPDLAVINNYLGAPNGSADQTRLPISMGLPIRGIRSPKPLALPKFGL